MPSVKRQACKSNKLRTALAGCAYTKMTKKHFEAIAEVLHNEIVYANDNLNAGSVDARLVCEAVLKIADELASLFATYNANFNREKFLKAVNGN